LSAQYANEAQVHRFLCEQLSMTDREIQLAIFAAVFGGNATTGYGEIHSAQSEPV
jgi:hypothetical protein